MGKKKETTTTNTSTAQQVQYTASPEERALNALLLSREQENDALIRSTQRAGLQTSQALLTGSALPGAYGDLYAGISPSTTDYIVNRSVADVQPQLQTAGLLDSGVNASLSSRLAGDIRTSTEQWNLSNRLNLLGLAFSGQLQAQSPIMQQTGMLSNNLSGLRSMNSTGQSSGTTTTKSMNPFLNSFQTSLGSGLGTGFATGIGNAAGAFGRV